MCDLTPMHRLAVELDALQRVHSRFSEALGEWMGQMGIVIDVAQLVAGQASCLEEER